MYIFDHLCYDDEKHRKVNKAFRCKVIRVTYKYKAIIETDRMRRLINCLRQYILKKQD